MDEQVLSLLQSMNAGINQIKEEVRSVNDEVKSIKEIQEDLIARVDGIEGGVSVETIAFDIEPPKQYSIYEVMFSGDRTSPGPNSTMNVIWNTHSRHQDREEAIRVGKELQEKGYQVSVSTITEIS